MTPNESDPKTRSPKPKRIHHQDLLRNPDIRRWYNATTHRSPLTAAVNLRQVALMCDRIGVTMPELVTIARDEPTKMRDLMTDYADNLQNEGLTAAYIAKTFSGTRSWLRYNMVSFEFFPDLKVVQSTTLKAEKVPSPEQLNQILNGLSTRGRVAALLMAHAGLRPGVLGNYNGKKGLQLRDIKDLDLDGKNGPTFRRTPALIEVPEDLSKTRKLYSTFIGEQAADSLEAYLRERQTKFGETLTPESPIISAQYRADGRENAYVPGFVTTKAITKEIRRGLDSQMPGGTHCRPYALRAFFSSMMVICEGRGLCTSTHREAMMGHTVDTDKRYNVGKPLPPHLLEDLREHYAKCEPLLSTIKMVRRVEEVEDKYRSIVAGFKADYDAKLAELKAAIENTQRGAGRKADPAPAPAGMDVSALLAAGWTPPKA